MLIRKYNKRPERTWRRRFVMWAQTLSGLVVLETVETRLFPGTAMRQYRRLQHRRKLK